MNTLEIKKSVLSGEVRVSGAKNSALRLLAASILTSEPVILSNYPGSLSDCQIHEEMLRVLGKQVSQAEGEEEIIISEEGGSLKTSLNWEGRSIRNTLLILGALVAREGEGRVPLPGGCKLGSRMHDLHILALESLGAKVWEEGDYLCAAIKNGKRLKGNVIDLPLRSTGATENSLIMASLAEGETKILGPHIKPEILDLVAFLKGLGVVIEVRGQESITVVGTDKLSGHHHTVVPDSVEALTWLIAATITGGSIQIHDFPFEHLEVPLSFLRESGVNWFTRDKTVLVTGGAPYPVEISTGPYPGINSDMQPLFALLGARALGESRIVDLRFPGRYGYLAELEKLGGSGKVEGDFLKIFGSNAGLVGSTVQALDLRAGIALLLAGLCAEGSTIIEDAWQIERGYDRLCDKLSSLDVNFKVLN